jgi:hypothetical protein
VFSFFGKNLGLPNVPGLVVRNNLYDPKTCKLLQPKNTAAAPEPPPRTERSEPIAAVEPPAASVQKPPKKKRKKKTVTVRPNEVCEEVLGINNNKEDAVFSVPLGPDEEKLRDGLCRPPPRSPPREEDYPDASEIPDDLPEGYGAVEDVPIGCW